MNHTLTISERLKDLRVVDKGLTLEQLAEATKISKSTLGKYEQDDSKDMSPFNIAVLAKFYGVSTDYLLGLTETKNHPYTEVASLGLDDKTIEILLTKKLNKRLISELISHPDFPMMLVDMEIYVDRIASMQVQHLNIGVDDARKKVMAQYAPESTDVIFRTLEVSHIDEHEYFTKTIYNDLSSIIKDIQTKHITDQSTADATNVVVRLREEFKDADPAEATTAENKARVFCKTLSIDFDKLSYHQFEVLIQILELSSHMAPIDNRRGRRQKQKNH